MCASTRKAIAPHAGGAHKTRDLTFGFAITVLYYMYYMYCTTCSKKTPGGAGTHTGHAGAHGLTDHTQTNHPNRPTHQHDSATTESAADSTAAAPEPTAPRERLS